MGNEGKKGFLTDILKISAKVTQILVNFWQYGAETDSFDILKISA